MSDQGSRQGVGTDLLRRSREYGEEVQDDCEPVTTVVVPPKGTEPGGPGGWESTVRDTSTYTPSPSTETSTFLPHPLGTLLDPVVEGLDG